MKVSASGHRRKLFHEAIKGLPEMVRDLVAEGWICTHEDSRLGYFGRRNWRSLYLATLRKPFSAPSGDTLRISATEARGGSATVSIVGNVEAAAKLIAKVQKKVANNA